MDELNRGDVEIYKFPTNDEKEAELNSSMNVSCKLGTIPFDVITIKAGF